MRISEIRYEAKINLGNYEHEILSATAVLEENEKMESCVASLRNAVRSSLGQASVVSEQTETKEEVKKEEAKQEVKEETKAEETPAEAKQEEPKKERKKRETKPKVTVYDRTNDFLKSRLVDTMDKKLPEWNKNPAKAKAMSEFLSGKPMMNESGVVLESFVDAAIDFFLKN